MKVCAVNIPMQPHESPGSLSWMLGSRIIRFSIMNAGLTNHQVPYHECWAHESSGSVSWMLGSRIIRFRIMNAGPRIIRFLIMNAGLTNHQVSYHECWATNHQVSYHECWAPYPHPLHRHFPSRSKSANRRLCFPRKQDLVGVISTPLLTWRPRLLLISSLTSWLSRGKIQVVTPKNA